MICRVDITARALAVAICVALVGCSGSATVTPPAISNISGDYSGTVQDSANGNGTATGTLAQTGSNAGGAIALTGTSTLSAQFSITINSSNAYSGAMVIDMPANGPACSFSTSGTYDPSTGVLAGSYKAVTNCSGQSGTYSLTQQCTDTVTSHVRRMGTGIISC